MAQILRSTILGAFSKYPDIPDEIRDYVADSAYGLVEDIKDMDADRISLEIFDCINPLLEGSMCESEVKDLCTKFARAFKGLNPEPPNDMSDNAKLSKGTDYVVRCDSIILAYAGKSLLRSTSLILKRRCCYGIVGQNGVGKTTLLNRIASGEISGFPRDVRVIYVQHEILANDEQTVIDYLKGLANLHGVTGSDISKVLEHMGFSDEMQQKSVGSIHLSQTSLFIH